MLACLEIIAGSGGTGHHPEWWVVFACSGTIADLGDFVVPAKKLAVPELFLGSWHLELCQPVVSGAWVDLGDIGHHPECWKESSGLGCFWYPALPAKQPAVQKSFLCCYYLDHCGLLVLQKADLASSLHSRDRLYSAQWWKTWSRSVQRTGERTWCPKSR